MAIYVNGCKENWKDLPWDPTVPPSNMMDIGKVHTAAHTPNGARHFFNGYIDEVRISDIARTYECQENIPTLTEWGLIIFGLVLIGFITWVFLKRRKVIGVRL